MCNGHNALMEFIDGELEETETYKYVDDLTRSETVDKEISCLIKTSHDSTTTHVFRPKKIQEGFDLISEFWQSKGLKINNEKTQILSILSSRYCQNPSLSIFRLF